MAQKRKSQRSGEAPLSASIQTELNRLGCKAGRPDGQWGRGSQRALDRLGEKRPALKGAKRTDALLTQLKSLPDLTCVLSCAANQKIQGGTCVALSCKKGQILEADGTCKDTFASQINNALTGLNNITGLVNVGRFDGRWLIEIKANKRCATRTSAYYVDIKKSRISGTTEYGRTRTGRVSPSGKLEIKGKPNSGRGKAIILTAKIKQASGKGKLKLDRGATCRGTFVMTKQ